MEFLLELSEIYKLKYASSAQHLSSAWSSDTNLETSDSTISTMLSANSIHLGHRSVVLTLYIEFLSSTASSISPSTSHMAITQCASFGREKKTIKTWYWYALCWNKCFEYGGPINKGNHTSHYLCNNVNIINCDVAKIFENHIIVKLQIIYWIIDPLLLDKDEAWEGQWIKCFN